jgi:uncharacterized cupin superfamily protein
MPKIDIASAPKVTGSRYPEVFAEPCRTRTNCQLGNAAGLTQFGANLFTVPPGGRSSLRHWHRDEDEFVMVTEGELVLVQDEGEYPMRAGDCAGWKAGDTNGHCFLNRSDRPARFLVVGSKSPNEVVTYSDVDFRIAMHDRKAELTYRDGTPWNGPR